MINKVYMLWSSEQIFLNFRVNWSKLYDKENVCNHDNEIKDEN